MLKMPGLIYDPHNGIALDGHSRHRKHAPGLLQRRGLRHYPPVGLGILGEIVGAETGPDQGFLPRRLENGDGVDMSLTSITAWARYGAREGCGG